MEIIKTLINLDVRIYVYVGLFLFLAIGVLYKDKPNNIKDYALGTKAFSTPALVATMVATFIGAGNTIGYVTVHYFTIMVYYLLYYQYVVVLHIYYLYVIYYHSLINITED